MFSILAVEDDKTLNKLVGGDSTCNSKENEGCEFILTLVLPYHF
ncbi:hypothetical protein [Anaerovirgula multivorans]|nr:hypothetical protein [Anaerovirgula multivorans]